MTRSRITSSLAALANVFLVGSISAHEAWVQPGPGPVYPIEYGDFTPEAYPASKISSLDALDSAGHKLKATFDKTPYGAVAKISGAPSIVLLEFDNGYYTQTADGISVNLPKAKVPGGTTTSHPLKFAKTILKWDATAYKPVGQKIEIVPIGSGVPKHKAPLTVQVLLDGKPLADVEVESVGITPEGKSPHTDADGKLTIEIDHGIQRLAALYKLPESGEPNVDSKSLTAALLFVVD